MSRVRTNRVAEFTEGAGVTIDDPRFASGPWFDVTSSEFGAEGDGTTDDTDAVEAAYAAAIAAGGGVVFVPAHKSCKITSSITVSGTGVTFAGPGTIKATTDIKLFTVTGTRIGFSGLTLDGTQTAGGSTGHLIECSGATDVRIERCRLNNARLSAVRIHDSDRVWVLYNDIDKPYEHGVYVTPPSSQLWIIGNRINEPGENASAGALGKGILFAASSGFAGVNDRFRIAHNEVIDARHVSIEIWTDDSDIDANTNRTGVLIGNHVEQSGSGADHICYSVAGSTDIACVGNVAEGGIISFEVAYSKRVTYAENVSRNCAGTAISISKSVGGDLTSPSEFTIKGNTIYRPETNGIQVFGASGVANFSICDNVITGAGGGATAIGIILNALGSGVYWTVSGNVVTGMTHSGIYIQTSYNGTLTGNVAEGNNTAASGSHDDIYLNMASQAVQDTIQVRGNIGSITSSFPISSVTRNLAGTATWDPGSLNDGAQATTTVTVTGAVVGDCAIAGFSNSLQGQLLTAYVSAADTVTVVLQNESGGVLDLASGTLRAVVFKHT